MSHWPPAGGAGAAPSWQQTPGASPQQNGWVIRTLRSPDHARLSDRILLLTFTGRKTGTRYEVPVSYLRERAAILCFTDSPWWRNLAGGAPVEVLVAGASLPAVATPETDPASVAAGLRRLLAHDPDDAAYFGVPVGPDGRPDAAALEHAAARTVLLRIVPAAGGGA